MSNPDPRPPSDDAPPLRSDFLSVCGIVLTILSGVLLLPGICIFYPDLTGSVIAIGALAGLAIIVGGIVWATRTGGARRR